MRVRPWVLLFSALVLVFSNFSSALAQEKKAPNAAPPKEGVLKAAEVGDKLFPDKVFFRGLVASVQARNSGGVRYADGFLVMAGLVDNSGYSTGIKEKYQGYLISEVPIEVGGKTLNPGAYGFGFIEGDKLVVMDLGANDVFQVTSTKDAEIKRPVPLQFLAGSEASKYRLYKGKDYVEFKRVK
jgi:hypothetical protein